MMVSDNDQENSINEEDDQEERTEENQDFMQWVESGPREVRRGDIVEGVVAGLSADGVHVDVGAKLEAVIPRSEFPTEADLPQVEDKVEVAVLRVDEENGVLRVSKRRADFERVWRDLAQVAKEGGVVDAMVTERVKGGLRVDLGVPGFVPASQVGTRDVRNLERFVGQSLRLKVLEVDRRQKKVILSHRQVVDEEREQKRAETLTNLEEGVVVEGKVRNLTSYGAFVDLGGVDGLLHISEMAWSRIKDPSEVLKVGETISVVVLDVNQETGKISLSRRQILPDPWKEAAKKLKPGQLLRGRITRVVRNGAFAQLSEAGIEGFIPISEMSQRRINDPSEVVSAGQEVDVKILDIRVSARRMTLSMAEAEQEKERREYRAYMESEKPAPVTLGDRFGDILQQVASEEITDLEEPMEKEEAAAVPHSIELPDPETAAEQQNYEATASELMLTDEPDEAFESEEQFDLGAYPSAEEIVLEKIEEESEEEAEEDEAEEESED